MQDSTREEVMDAVGHAGRKEGDQLEGEMVEEANQTLMPATYLLHLELCVGRARACLRAGL